MTKVLYINHGHGDRCGVWSYGWRHYQTLCGDENYTFVYAEVCQESDFDEAYRNHKPDVIIFNYAHIVMPWVGPQLQRYPGVKFCMQHNYDQSSLDSIHNGYRGIFDYVVVLDPTITSIPGKVFALGRPIPVYTPHQEFEHDGEIHIGSFGFALHHKQFPLLMREVNSCFDNAVLNLHMTEGRFAAGFSTGILDSIKAEITKPGVRLNHTNAYLSEDDVVELLAQNHINALFYSWPPDNAGLSSSTDFMIAAQRPILVSDCAMFNHIRRGSFQYPLVTFTDILGDFRNCELEATMLYERAHGQLDIETKNMLRSVGL